MAQISNTELLATKQDLVASIVQETLKQRAMLIPTVSDYSSFAVKGAKQVDVPRRTEFAAADKTENIALTAQEMTFSVDSIALDKKKAIKADIELLESIQSAVNVEAQVITEMANELALQVDRDIITELKLASSAAPDHIIAFTSPSVMEKDDILNIRELLLIQNIPADDQWYLGIHPTQEKALLGIADFIRNDSYGSPEGLRRGILGKVFNFNVVVHTGFDPAEVVGWHKSAVGYANQMQPMFKRDEDLSNIADEFLLAMVYGCEVLDSGKRQVLVNATGA
jgi:N4-gp56 family major capsid protein